MTWELDGVAAVPVVRDRSPDLVIICSRRTDATELISTEGVDGAGVCNAFRAGWRAGALFTRLNDSILGGVVIVAWPSSCQEYI